MARPGKSYFDPAPSTLHCPRPNPDHPEGLWPISELQGLPLEAIERLTGDDTKNAAYWARRGVKYKMVRHHRRRNRR